MDVGEDRDAQTSAPFHGEGERERTEARLAELPQVDRLDRDLGFTHDRDRFAEAQVRGNPNAVSVEAKDATVEEILLALADAFDVHFRSSANLEKRLTGTYEGTLQQVLTRPDDFDAVRDMHAKMSPDNLYLRFFINVHQAPRL